MSLHGCSKGRHQAIEIARSRSAVGTTVRRILLLQSGELLRKSVGSTIDPAPTRWGTDMTLKTALAAAASLAGILVLGAAPSAAVAAVFLSDNFNGDPRELNWPGDAVFTSTPPPGNVQGLPSVDLVGPGFFSLCAPGQGNCVDLDGSTGNGNFPAGQLTSNASFGPGTYTVHFALAGNERGAAPETTDISLGSFSTSLTLLPSDPWANHSITFTTTSPGNLVFTDLGPSDQQGNLLDNVALTSVPEPATWAMMLLGVAGVGTMMRGRNRPLVDPAVI
jgi:hypothetical protein